MDVGLRPQSLLMFNVCLISQIRARSIACNERRQWESLNASYLLTTLSNNQQRALEASREKGASTWMSALPLADHGFTLQKWGL